MYTPPRTKKFHNEVAGTALSELQEVFFECPIRVDVLAVMKRPKRLCRKKDPEGLIWNDGTRPDADNIRKAVLDGLIYHFDDKWVIGGDTLKVFSGKGESGRVVIRITDSIGAVARWQQFYKLGEDKDEHRRRKRGAW
jgi:Holliday junction resolvase RusA-like endonuclease